MAYFRQQLGIGHLETTGDGLFSYEEAECLAACDRAPCMQVNLEFVYDLTVEKVDALLHAMRDGTYPVAPLPQNVAPGRDWHVVQDGKKAKASRRYLAAAGRDRRLDFAQRSARSGRRGVSDGSQVVVSAQQRPSAVSRV